MALRGRLKDFSLPDVFQLITFSRKTGVLRISGGGDRTGAVWFREGEVFFAQSNWHHEPLGERLVAARKITPSALEKALALRVSEPEGGRRLGRVLVDEGYITEKVLEAFVQEQIQDTIFDLMRWESGEFDFELLPEVVDEDIGLTVSIENVIMEGSRRLDEWARIKKKVPSMDVIFKMATAPGEGTFEISLKPIEWSLLLLVDGTRSVAELARATNRTDFEVARILYGLFSAGLLEFAPGAEIDDSRQSEAVALADGDGAVTELASESGFEPEPEIEPEPESDLIFLPSEPELDTESDLEFESVPPPAVEPEFEPITPPRPEPEAPRFLSDAGPLLETTDDVTSFAEMMDVMLETPEAEPAASEHAPEPEPEPEPEPAPELEPAPEAEAPLNFVPAQQSQPAPMFEPMAAPDIEEPDLSGLLESLEEPAVDEAPAIAESERPGPLVEEEPSFPEVERVPESPPTAEETGDDLSLEMTDEIGALTGARTARPQVSVTTIPREGRISGPRRDDAVDRLLVLKIIDGLKKL